MRMTHPRPTKTHHRFDPDRAAAMPPKRKRRHRWVAIATYVLDDTDAAKAHEGADVSLGVDKLADLGIGCLDCEGLYAQVATEPCRAPAFHWLGGGVGGTPPA